MQFPHHYNSPLTKCVIRVDQKLYDCTQWRHSHPGGAELIDKFHNLDATDAFYAFHSQDACAKLQRMKGLECTAKQDDVTVAFQDFRKHLLRDGWFKRSFVAEFFVVLLPCISMMVLGTMLAYSHPWIATLLLGTAWQQAGWIGHDYMHGRGTASQVLGFIFGGLVNGFSSAWWNHKHNTHHAFPNRLEVDSDIHNEPIIHLWFPDGKKDVWYRKYQHYYYLAAYSLLYVSWRMQSIQFVLGSKNWLERALLAANYIYLAMLPFPVAIGSVLLGGLMVAVVVTANHQTEDIIERDAPYNFVVDTVNTTRGVHCADWIAEYLFGGMQYQLEHHLFPTMPRIYYRSLRPLVDQFCAKHGLQHHISGVSEIFVMNFQVMKKYAEEAKPVEGKKSK